MRFTDKSTFRTGVIQCFLTRFLAGVLLVLQFGAAPTGTETKPQAQTQPQTKSQPKIRISFRAFMINKKTALHIHDANAATETEKILKQLGCTTSRSQHDGHIDLAYECKYWRSLNVKDQAEADKWIQWLGKHKFAVVENTPPRTRKETVQYHCKEWKTVHPKSTDQTKMFVEMFKMLGCEVTTAKHNGHDDVRFRCASTQSLGVNTHRIAHDWIKQLNSLGFVTMHEH